MEPIYIDVPVVIRISVQKLVRLTEEAQTGVNTSVETIYASPMANVILKKPEKEDFDMGEAYDTAFKGITGVSGSFDKPKRHYHKRKKAGVKKKEKKRAYHKHSGDDAGRPHPLGSKPDKVSQAVEEAIKSSRPFSSVFKELFGYNPSSKYVNKAFSMGCPKSKGRKKQLDLILRCTCGKRFIQKYWYDKHVEHCPGYNKFQSAKNPSYAEKLKKDNDYMASIASSEEKITFLCGICEKNPVDEKGEICNDCGRLIDEKNRAEKECSGSGVRKGMKRGHKKRKKRG